MADTAKQLLNLVFSDELFIVRIHRLPDPTTAAPQI
jgi:hypothetical protein